VFPGKEAESYKNKERNMPSQSFQKIVSLSELLNTTLKQQLTEMPHLKGESEELDQLITDVKGLDQEQETLRGRLLEIVRKRKEAERRGNDLRSRVAAQLRGKLGFTNENLLAYGIKPRKRERKKPTKKQVPPPEVTTAAGQQPAQQQMADDPKNPQWPQ
jgi:hypothetical protein